MNQLMINIYTIYIHYVLSTISYTSCASSREEKQVAAQLKSSEHSTNLAKWAIIKVSDMAFILQVKWNQCAKFRQALISTEGMTICEATSCDYWGIGVAPNLAQYTKPSLFLGEDNMGKLQMALRLYNMFLGMESSMTRTRWFYLVSHPV